MAIGLSTSSPVTPKVKCPDYTGSRTVKHVGNPKEYRERRNGGRQQSPFAFLLFDRQPFERRYFFKSLTEKRENKELNPHLLQTTGSVKDKDQKVLLLPCVFADKEGEEGQCIETWRHCQNSWP